MIKVNRLNISNDKKGKIDDNYKDYVWDWLREYQNCEYYNLMLL
jgi:hypothetical protein